MNVDSTARILFDALGFSWTMLSFLMVAQAWVFTKIYEIGRKKALDYVALIGPLALSSIAALLLWQLYGNVLHQSLLQIPNFLDDAIKKKRESFQWSLFWSFIFSIFSVIRLLIRKGSNTL